MSAAIYIDSRGFPKIQANIREPATIEAIVQSEPPAPVLEVHLATSLESYAAAGGTLPVFSAVTPGTSYTRSTTCWLRDLDWTGVSPWNSTGANERGGTAISPRHIVFADHYPISNGATVKFVTADNSIVERTMTSSQQIGSTDIRIGVLDSDLPASIKFYKVLPSYIQSSVYAAPVPCVSFDKQQRVTARHNDSNGSVGTIATGDLAPFSVSLQIGDSGQPVFWILFEEPVVILTWLGSFGSPEIRDHLSAINAAMTSLGGGYQLTIYDIANTFAYYGDF